MKTAQAGTLYTWNGITSSDWNEPLNWTPNGIPTSSDNITFGNAPHACVLTTDLSITNLILNNNSSLNLNHFNLIVAGNFTCTAGSHLELAGGNLTVQGNATVNGGSLSDLDSIGLISLSGSTTQFGSSSGGPTLDALLSVNSSTITMRSTTFNRGVVIRKSGSSGDYSYGGNVFNGIAEIINAGTGNLILSNTAKDVFNRVVTFSNLGSAGIYPAYNDASGTQFNDSVFVNSTSGTGILFGASTGNAILAADKKIKIGTSGFTAGTLSLRHFTQLSSSEQAIALGAASTLSLGPATTFEGNVLFESGGLLLNGATFQRKCSLAKTGGGNNNGNGGNIFNDTTTITNSGSGYLLTSNTQADQFNSATNVINNGSGDIYLAHSVAGTIFNGPVNILNAGSGASSRIFICEGNIASTAVFNDQLTVTNSGSATNSMIRFSLRGRITLRSDLFVNNTLGGINSNGIFFGWNGYAGTTVMDSLHRLQVGTSGFANGTLSLINFTKAGNDSLILPFMNSSGLTIGPATTIRGPVLASASSIYLNGCRFSSEVDFTKTGSANEAGTGSNSFERRASFTNNGSGTWIMENSNPDTFATAVTYTNSGAGSIQIAQGSAGNLFNGKVVLNNQGTGTTNRILVNEGTAAASSVFNDTVEVNNLSSATTAFVRFNLRGTSIFNNHLILNSTGGTGASNNGIYFGWQGYNGNATLATGKHIIIGQNGFSKGSLSLIRFSKLGLEQDSLILGNAATFVLGPSSIWNSELFCTGGGIALNGCAFSSRTEFIKTGSTSETSAGGNIFYGNSILTNSGSGYLLMGNSLPDIFNGDLEVNNLGSSYFYLGYNSSGNEFRGNVVLNNAGTGSDTRILIGEGNAVATNTFSGDLTVNNLSTSTDGLVRFNLRGTTNFLGNIIVSNSVGVAANNGIDFGWPGFSGSANLATGKTISIGATGFTKGTLLFQNFIQDGATPQSLTLTGSASLIFGSNSVFNGSVNAISPELFFNGSTFNGALHAEKNSNNSNACSGNNNFNASSEFLNNGTNNWTFSNSTKDRFNGTVSIRNNSIGTIYLAHNDASGTQFNDNIILENASTGSIRFGQGSGSCSLAAGKTINFGPIGFLNGSLYLRNFNQLGTSPQSFLLPSGTASLVFQTGTIFNGNLDVNVPQLFLNGSTFNGVSTLTKNGATNNACIGGNSFNADVSIRTSGSGLLYMANTTGDNFNAGANFRQNGIGQIYPAYNSVSNFRGNISTQGSDTVVTFAAAGGSISINGSALQYFYGDAGKHPRIRRMTMSNSAGLALNIPISIYTSLTMSLGNIFTSNANLLTIENGISSVSSASDNSYVEGPMRKIGNQSFLFPVGKNSKYRPIGITPPGATTDQYIAEYIHANPNSSYNINSKDATLEKISQCEYWTLNKIGGASNPFITLSWSSTSCGINSIGDLRVARWDGALSKWRDMGNASTTGNPTSGTVLSSLNSSSYIVYTLGSVGTSNVLPIELSRFDVKGENESVRVEWETMSEINNDFFTVERSKDGINFEEIGKVKGAGNSTSRLTYGFLDESPFAGLSFYRLKQTDFDGKFVNFEPVSVKTKSSMADFKLETIGPNPFTDHLILEYHLGSEKNLVFQLYTIGGSFVSQKENNSSIGTTRFEFTDVGDLPPGMYILKIISEGEELYSAKVVK